MPLATKPKRKPLAAKKRVAGHHTQGKHYLKPYWPYLPMLLIVGLGLYVNSIWSASQVLGVSQDFSSQRLLDDTNAARASSNLLPLSDDPQLSSAAQAKADDLVRQNYWSHTSPDGSTPWAFIAAAGYQYQLAGENLAYGFPSADATVTGWMNSAEHRDNILNSAYTNVGFGVAQSTNYQGKGPQTVIVAEYAEPVATAATISFTVPNPPQSTPAPAVKGAHAELAARNVSRIQILTGGQAAWSMVLVSALAGAALALFIIRHGLRIHRLVSRGEAFVAHHPYFDIIIVLIFTLGFILTRTTGIIR